jgi:small subunit ribosomal protein S9
MAVKKVEKTEKVAKVAKTTKAVKPKAEKVVKVAKVAKEVKAEKVEKAVKVEKVVKVVEKVAKKISGKYFYAVGRRKTSIAQVRLFENDKAVDTDLVINEKKMKDYFPTISLQNNMLAPLKAIGMHGKFTMTVLVRGGGVTGQVEAVRLGISRALVVFNPEFKKTLKDLGFMTRDAREVERKKPGLKKARKSPQWAKR